MIKLSFKTGLQTAEWPQIIAMWERAEQLERLEGGWVNDHLYHPAYPDKSDTTFCYEAFTALAAAAARTERLRLGTMVVANRLRHPAVVAKMAVTIDHISGGRFDLGMGAGWHEPEHLDHGFPLYPIRERVDAFAEAMAVLDSLLRNVETTFEGEHYRLSGAKTAPRPIQQPRIPFTIGGSKPRMMGLVARYADHWNMDGYDVEEFHAKRAELAQRCAEINRDAAEIEISAQFWIGRDVGKARSRAEALAAAGVDHIILSFYQPDPDFLETTVTALGDL